MGGLPEVWGQVAVRVLERLERRFHEVTLKKGPVVDAVDVVTMSGRVDGEVSAVGVGVVRN